MIKRYVSTQYQPRDYNTAELRHAMSRDILASRDYELTRDRRLVSRDT